MSGASIDQPVIIATFAVYMAVCLVLGLVAWQRTGSLADYLLGGRSLGSWVTAFGAQASDMSGWLLMGLPGLAYAGSLSGGLTGSSDAVWLATGLAAGTWLNWRYVAAPLRQATEQAGNALTLPDYLEHRFADHTRVLRSLSAVLILIFFTSYASAGFVAAGKLFESLFGMPYIEAMVWGSAVMLAYTVIGGFLAVSWSDVLQGSLMFVALIVVAALGVALVGGPVDGIARLGTVPSELMGSEPAAGSVDATHATLSVIGIVSLLAWGLGYPGQPHILARFMAIRTVAAIPVARRVATIWTVIVLAAAVVIGVTGAAVIDPPLSGAERETVFIALSTRHLHPVLAGICLAGILAAIMSTAAAQLLVASSAFAEDLYRGFVRRGATNRELLWAGRIAVLVIAAIAFTIARDPASQVLDLVAWAWAGFGAAFGPVILFALYSTTVTRNAAVAGMLVGGVTVIVWGQTGGGLFGLYELVPGFLFSLATIAGVSRYSAWRSRFR
jgi:sodium/proline symporter